MKINFEKHTKQTPIRDLEAGTVIRVKSTKGIYIVPTPSYMFAMINYDGTIVGTTYNQENFLYRGDPYEILGKVSVTF
jgi:hypothetical protein